MFGWLLPQLESSYSQIADGDNTAPARGFALRQSAFQPTTGATLTAAPSGVWRDVILEYKRRKAAVDARPQLRAAPAAAAVPGGRNWLPLGPSVVVRGQTVGNQPVAGRVARLVVAPGGATVYAASANGGVFRSVDGGTAWRALMDGFDVDPTSFASSSVVCGAIAIDSNDPNRVYVGTGEGDTLQPFRVRISAALPAYRGVGMLRSDDGGTNWVQEPSSPDLAGEACFAIAVDPSNRENVVCATTNGLYRRTATDNGSYEWRRALEGVYSSVVVTSSNGATRFYCAQWGQSGKPSGIFRSDDGGNSWPSAGKGFAVADAGRIALGVQVNNIGTVYAFVARQSTGTTHGLYRIDGPTGNWTAIAGLPAVLPVDDQGQSQGGYDLAIAVDPVDANLVYLGGSYVEPAPYPASIWRCAISANDKALKVSQSKSIGTYAHADVHSLTHTPGEPDELWCTCDGGVFLNRAPRANGEFASQNNGLSCLCCNFLGQHPTDPNILFTGLQDNGTARTAAGPVWAHVMGGDGGYCVVNWAKPDNVLVYANGKVYRSTSGGTTEDEWTPVWQVTWATMTQPIVTPAYNPASPGEADIVAIGAGQDVYVSSDFASTWPKSFTVLGGPSAGDVFALAFASATRLFAGTTKGQVFRADKAGSSWTVSRVDNAAAGALGITGLIADAALDWADATLQSVYVAFGGMGDRRRVWHFDGTKWEARSGPTGGACLLDVEHNALAVDRSSPNDVYVGTDIGVWHSADNGQTWNPLENGLPDAPVFDLQIHPTQRLLRAALHGRGVYEMPLN